MGLFVAVGFVLLLMVLVAGAGVMFFDLTGRHEEDAEWLQATISDELRRDAGSSSHPVLAVVHAPVGAGVAVTVMVCAPLPTKTPAPRKSLKIDFEISPRVAGSVR
jgi:hypothetical protein